MEACRCCDVFSCVLYISSLLRERLSYDVRPEIKREDHPNCSVLCCICQLCTVIRTYMSSSCSYIRQFSFRVLFLLFSPDCVFGVSVGPFCVP